MRSEIKGERALVTGAGSGIGRTVSRKLASLGCDVVLVGRTSSSLEGTKALIDDDAVGSGEVRVCDLTREDSISTLVREVRGEGGLDILVNNAGIMSDTASFEPLRSAWHLLHPEPYTVTSLIVDISFSFSCLTGLNLILSRYLI